MIIIILPMSRQNLQIHFYVFTCSISLYVILSRFTVSSLAFIYFFLPLYYSQTFCIVTHNLLELHIFFNKHYISIFVCNINWILGVRIQNYGCHTLQSYQVFTCRFFFWNFFLPNDCDFSPSKYIIHTLYK